MSNNQNQNQKEQQVQQQVETPAQQTQQVQQQEQQPQVQVVVQPPKENWIKKHWKGVSAAITGAAAATISAVVAYRKGKTAGVNSAYCAQQQDSDYNLNPNE